MRSIIILISLFFILIISCTQEDPTSSYLGEKNSGKLFLMIDKEHAPESVVWIEAFLSKAGYDTISGEMNLLSDSTADLFLENIQAGEWHLRVDAKDSAEVILYTGETDVQIFAGFTTQVNLVLEPTGAGVGNIYIWVTWGTPTGSWNDYSGNPIFVPSGSYWDYNGVSEPKIFFDNNYFKMYYTAQGSGYSGFVGFAQSTDGINWIRPVSNPVLSPGLPGSWDETGVGGGVVVKSGSNYLMYYDGWFNTDGNWHIGLASSIDGINWIKNPNPILFGTSGMEYQIVPSSCIVIDSTYYLYFYGRNLPYLDIRLASSLDGVNWTKSPSNPILVADQAWEGLGVYCPSVYKINNHYEMIFMNAAGTGFGKATSVDGISWEKAESNPFFTKENTYNHWANYKVAYPNFIRINNHDRVYYTGFATSGPKKIGFVTK
jgi:predicted GH43/DUF377 family glycosyl hydrolase